MSRVLRATIRTLAALVVFAVAVAFTPLGTGLLLFTARLGVPGELAWSWVEGTPAGAIRIRGLVYQDGFRRLEIRSLTFDWSPRRLLHGELEVAALRLEGLRWRNRSPASSSRGPRQAPSLPVPSVAVRVRDLQLEDAEFSAGGREPVRVRQARIRAELDHAGLRVEALEAGFPQGRITLQGRLWSGSHGPELSMRLEAVPRQETWQRFRLRLEGPLERARVTGRLTLPRPHALTIRFDGWAGWRQDRLAWEGLRVQGGPALAAVTGGWWGLSGQGFDVRLDWRHMAWPPTEVPRWMSRNGRLHARGRPAAWSLEAAVPLSGPELPEGVLRLKGTGDRNGLRIDRLGADFLEGEWTGSGRLTWLPESTWTLKLEGRDIDPASWPDPHAGPWRGRLALVLHSRGGWEADGPEGWLRIDALSGRLRDREVRARGEVRLQSGTLSIASLEVRSGRSRIALQGTAGRTGLNLDWQARVDALDDFLPGASGRLSAEGKLTDRPDRVRITGILKGNGLRRGQDAVRELRAHWKIGLDPQAPVQFRIRARGVRLGAAAWEFLEADGEGTGASHRLRFEARGQAGAIRIVLAGGHAGKGHWNGTLQRAEWIGSPAGDWRLVRPAALRWDGARLEGEALCWAQNGTRLCLEPGVTEKGAQEIRARLRALPVRRLAFLHPVLADRDVRARLDLTGRWVAGAAVRGAGRLCLSAGSLRVRAGTQSRREPFEGGCLAFRLDETGLHSEGELRLDARNGVRLSLDLPGYRAGPLKRTQALKARVRLELERLDRLAPWLEGVDRLEGRAEGWVMLQGTVAAPRPKVELRLREGVLGLPAAGVDWTAVGLEAKSGGDGERIRIRFSARSGRGWMEATGELVLRALDRPRLTLRVRGRDFRAVALPEAVVDVTPDLQVRVQPGEVEVEGTVHLPRARLRPREFTQPVRISPDAVVLQRGREVAHERAWRIRTRVRLVLGDSVDIEARGLKARLGGDLTVIEKGDGIPLGRGSLVVREGTFRLQGTPLTIRSGRLLFADTPLEDPGLEIVLERETEDAVVRAHIGGTLREPTLSLSSEPPLPQTDMLALLLTGKRADEASPAQGRLLAEAAGKLGMAGGNLLGERLKDLFGLSDVALSLGASLNEASLALGTWLSPRLYVSWTVGLFDPVAAMRIRYRISRHLQIEVRSGAEGTGGDLLYTLEK